MIPFLLYGGAAVCVLWIAFAIHPALGMLILFGVGIALYQVLDALSGANEVKTKQPEKVEDTTQTEPN